MAESNTQKIEKLANELAEVTTRLRLLESGQNILTTTPKGISIEPYKSHAFTHFEDLIPLVQAINSGGGASYDLESRVTANELAINGLESSQTVLTSTVNATLPRVAANELSIDNIDNSLYPDYTTRIFRSFAEITPETVHGWVVGTASDGPYPNIPGDWAIIQIYLKSNGSRVIYAIGYNNGQTGLNELWAGRIDNYVVHSWVKIGPYTPPTWTEVSIRVFSTITGGTIKCYRQDRLVYIYLQGVSATVTSQRDLIIAADNIPKPLAAGLTTDVYYGTNEYAGFLWLDKEMDAIQLENLTHSSALNASIMYLSAN